LNEYNDLIKKSQVAYNFIWDEWFLFLREEKETEEERNWLSGESLVGEVENNP